MENKKLQYYFILGINHSLSKVDIINVLSKNPLDFAILEASEEILLIETEKKLEVDSLMLELGSAVKIGQIFEKYPKKNFPQSFLKEISKEKFENFFLADKDADLRFGTSVYNGGTGFKALNKTFFSTFKIAKILKKKFNLKYLNVKSRKIPSFLVDKAGFLSSGFELVIISSKDGAYIGKTLSVQDYKSYSLRDYGRPERDAKSGMIPPKLAKIMINLAGKNKNRTFLDPFCGSGTFLQELALLGYKNIIGTDLEQKAVYSTRKNLDWLFEKYSLDMKDYEIKIFKKDVRRLSSKLAENNIDAIVTEPYLGSPKAKYFSPGQITREISQLSLLYESTFGQFSKLLKKNGVVVITFPIFRFKNQFFNLEILEEIKKQGFKQKEFINPDISGFNLLNLKITPRNSIVYFHPGQTISREVFVFEKS